jgi:uroporphyrinogen-III synthase
LRDGLAEISLPFDEQRTRKWSSIRPPRELDRLARMLEAAGAETLRCPMVVIRDAPNPLPVQEWLGHFPFDDLILYTGEGLRRLHGFARRFEIETGFLSGLVRARKTMRGPKPELRDVGAQPDAVLPYVYVSAAEEQRVVELIDRMAGGEVEVIAFTSSPQVERLLEVAKGTQREETLQTALRATAIAAAGLVDAGDLQRRGFNVTITPDHSYFMKPLVTAIVAVLSR